MSRTNLHSPSKQTLSLTPYSTGFRPQNVVSGSRTALPNEQFPAANVSNNSICDDRAERSAGY